MSRFRQLTFGFLIGVWAMFILIKSDYSKVLSDPDVVDFQTWLLELFTFVVLTIVLLLPILCHKYTVSNN